MFPPSSPLVSSQRGGVLDGIVVGPVTPGGAEANRSSVLMTLQRSSLCHPIERPQQLLVQVVVPSLQLLWHLGTTGGGGPESPVCWPEHLALTWWDRVGVFSTSAKKLSNCEEQDSLV